MSKQLARDFKLWRDYLVGVAYRMLGSVVEAEDVVQEVYLRWHQTERCSVKDVRAYLTTVASRLCLDRLKAASRHRETYIGPWLPEPLIETREQPFEAEALARDTSFALMLTLERLSPLERAAFLLHDVFGLAFRDVAASLDREEATCRQLARRARQQVKNAGSRYRVSRSQHEQLANRFFTASRTGNIEVLRELLISEATLHTDGGGKRIAARRVIYGADKICRFFAGLARKKAPSSNPKWSRFLTVNGLPGWLTVEEDGLPQVTALELNDDGVQAVYVMRNPDKLKHLEHHLPN